MNLKKLVEDDKATIQVAPLIDVVFLLLIYFMVTSALVKKEADISFMLPASLDHQAPITLPIEVAIEINPDGDVIVEGMIFDRRDRELNTLVTRLMEFRAAAEASQSDLIVTINPDDSVLHGRIIDVMSACAVAEVKNTSFNLTTM